MTIIIVTLCSPVNIKFVTVATYVPIWLKEISV